jgi:hypothetical protein
MNPSRLATILLAGALALLPGCAEEEPELKGELGPGSGGPDVDANFVAGHDWTDPDGDSIGMFEWDASQFLHFHPDPEDESLHVVANVAPEVLLADLADGSLDELQDDEVVMLMSRIVGRADTPCRFQAALLARDEDYEITASGDRRNDQKLELHQVNLHNNAIPAHQRFYCFQLRDPFGIDINVITRGRESQDWEQVFYLLNSVDKS